MLKTRQSHGVLATQAVFALLVAASVGAFFVTTRLKRSTPVVQQLTFPRHLSPNGDGRLDAVRIGFRTKREDEVTVSIVDEDEDDVRTLARDRRLAAGRHRVRWDGRLDDGGIAPDGEYRVRIGLRHQARSLLSPRKLFVDTNPPAPVVRYVSPASISPDGAGLANRARLRFDGPVRTPPLLLVYRTDTARPRLVARREGRAGEQELVWDGRVGPGRGSPAATGSYLMLVRARDAAGNVGPIGPPVRGRFSGHPGLLVSYVSARAPSRPVRAGERARFRVSSDGRRYRWRVRRLGSSRVVARGSSRATSLAIRVPRGRGGVHVLSLTVGSHAHQVPFAVEGRRRARVLVVLPAAEWQARNRLDANGDGFPDRLDADGSVRLDRPFANSGLPPGFGAVEAPLLISLERDRRRYDVTSDIALASADEAVLPRYRGLLFAGPPRRFPADLGRRLRSYVRAGGRVAWPGTGGFTTPVRVRGAELVGGERTGGRNLFGERVQKVTPGDRLVVLGDRIGFFAGISAPLGPFPAIEQSSGPGGGRLLASAGREAGRPAISVRRRARGVIVRAGADGLARFADRSPDVARIMRRLWTLVSR